MQTIPYDMTVAQPAQPAQPAQISAITRCTAIRRSRDLLVRIFSRLPVAEWQRLHLSTSSGSQNPVEAFAPYLSVECVKRRYREMTSSALAKTRLSLAEKLRLRDDAISVEAFYTWSKITVEDARGADLTIAAVRVGLMYNTTLTADVVAILRASSHTRVHQFVGITVGLLNQYAPSIGKCSRSLAPNTTLAKSECHSTYAAYTFMDSHELMSLFADDAQWLASVVRSHVKNPNATERWLLDVAGTWTERDTWVFEYYSNMSFDNYMRLPEILRKVTLPATASDEWWTEFLTRPVLIPRPTFAFLADDNLPPVYVDDRHRRLGAIRRLVTNGAPVADVIVAATSKKYGDVHYDEALSEYNRHYARCIRELANEIADALADRLWVPGGHRCHQMMAGIA